MNDLFDEELLDVFAEEARGELDEMERCLEELRRDPLAADAMVVAARAAHTLRGNAATLGFAEAAALAGDLEQLLKGLALFRHPARDALLRTLPLGLAALRESVSAALSGGSTSDAA